MQTGVVPPHLVTFVAEHCPHDPVAWQAGVAPPQSTSPAHGRHVCVAVLHTGVAPPQFPFETQLTQVREATSHTEVAPPQRLAFVAEHCPQAPEGSHAGLAPLQSTSPAHARHTCVAVLQTGVAPPHWASGRIEAQVPDAALQIGVAPVHSVLLEAEQTPHAPDGSHAGLAPLQSTSPVHARHTPVAALQIGFVPPHALAFVAEHCPHAPVGSHAGVAPLQSTSPAHARHVWVAPLQTGVEPLQSAFAVQRTQTPVAALHTGVPPVQAVALPTEHWPHAPVGSHAGVAPLQSIRLSGARSGTCASCRADGRHIMQSVSAQRTQTPAAAARHRRAAPGCGRVARPSTARTRPSARTPA